MTAMRPPSQKRYGWSRRYNGFPYHQKWTTVARRTKVEKCRVIAIVDCLQDAANRGRPRGNLEEFKIAECAAGLEIPERDVRKVWKSLEQLGWIDRQQIVTWDDRQPDREDNTAAERQRRKRALIKQANFGLSRRDMRDVTPKNQTEISKEEASITELASGSHVSWEQAQAAGYKPPKQRPLFGPLPVHQKRSLR